MAVVLCREGVDSLWLLGCDSLPLVNEDSTRLPKCLPCGRDAQFCVPHRVLESALENGAAGNSPAVATAFLLAFGCCASDVCSVQAAQSPPSAETPAQCQGCWVLPARCVRDGVGCSLQWIRRRLSRGVCVGDERKEPLSSQTSTLREERASKWRSQE